MARTKANKFTQIASNVTRNTPFIDSLNPEERTIFEKMSVTEQEECERYCIQNPNSGVLQYAALLQKIEPNNNSNNNKPSSNPETVVITEQKIETKPKDKRKTEQNNIAPKNNTKIEVSNIEPDETIQKVQSLISNSFIEKEAGKNISVYLSAESLKLLAEYKKKHKISNRSSLIDALIKNVLK